MARMKKASTVVLVFFSMIGLNSPVAVAQDKNEFGMITVKCHAVRNGPGNPIVGYVVGNHVSSLSNAKKDADLYLSVFSFSARKRHCKAQRKYLPSGAYDTRMNPL
ncbi:hypothetical protein CFELI_09770 [Corynebacterium felinum]|uniref:Secreted protein n=1 Tax=Corynebacterium felinum TaxID=131318 RepID=A0ABU2BFQ8_9CORY|nr:hypothetical protein [Corynebacterium felinum]WJY95556.1 hypothetical protein CFELI_09770 [Corynebacterium felinum]